MNTWRRRGTLAAICTGHSNRGLSRQAARRLLLGRKRLTDAPQNTARVNHREVTHAPRSVVRWINIDTELLTSRASANLSEIDVSMSATGGQGAALAVTDPKGNITGQTLAGPYENILNGSISGESSENISTGVPASDNYTLLQILTPATGKYSVQISVPYSGTPSYAGQIDGYAANGTRLFDVPFSGTLSYGQSTSVSFSYAVPEPGSITLAAIGLVALKRWPRRRS